MARAETAMNATFLKKNFLTKEALYSNVNNSVL